MNCTVSPADTDNLSLYPVIFNPYLLQGTRLFIPLIATSIPNDYSNGLGSRKRSKTFCNALLMPFSPLLAKSAPHHEIDPTENTAPPPGRGAKTMSDRTRSLSGPPCRESDVVKSSIAA